MKRGILVVEVPETKGGKPCGASISVDAAAFQRSSLDPFAGGTISIDERARRLSTFAVGCKRFFVTDRGGTKRNVPFSTQNIFEILRRADWICDAIEESLKDYTSANRPQAGG